MTCPIDPDTLKDPRRAAQYWLVREQSGLMPEAERQRLDEWRRADPAHELEYKRARGIWKAVALIPPERLQALVDRPAKDRPAFLRQRRLALRWAAACTAAVVAAVGLSHWPGPAEYSALLTAAQGERRQVTLPDDSVVELDTGATLTVHFYAGRRVVELSRGEALFTVTHDAHRPFLVKTGDTVVRVTGTQFDVRRDDASVRVGVEQGSVEVKHGPWWNRDTALLGAGQVVRTLPSGHLSEVRQADMAALLAWRQGRIVFRNTPLPQAVEEMNRYAARAIRLDDPALANVRIAGIYSTDDVQSFLQLLPTIAPVRVVRQPDGTAVITAR